MRITRVLAAALLAVTGLVAVSATAETASAAGSKALTVSYGGKVIKNETFTARGTLSAPAARTVKLQSRLKTSGTWTTVDSTTSNASGVFTFSRSTTKARYYRFVAPAVSGKARIDGSPTRVTVVKQTASAYANPYPATYTVPFATAYNGTAYIVATFTPARSGRKVTFTSPNGALVSGTEDSRGRVVMPFALNKSAGTYTTTVTVDAKNGAGAKSASPTPVKVEARSFVVVLP